MYLSTVPPCLNTIWVISVRYSRSISATCSGWSFSEMDVKPRRSEKSTVTRRRLDSSAFSSLPRTTERRTSGEKNRERRRFSRCSRTKCSTTVEP